MSGNKMNKEMEHLLDEMSMERFGRKRSECLDNKICVVCGSEAYQFKNEDAYKEFLIGAVCQKCQDDDEEDNQPEELWC